MNLDGYYFVPLCVPQADSCGPFGRWVDPDGSGLRFGFGDDPSSMVRFGTTDPRDPESHGHAVGPGRGSAAMKSTTRSLVGAMRAIGLVDQVIGPDHGTLFVGSEFVRVPRFLPDSAFFFPLPPMPAIGVTDAGYEKMVAYLRRSLPTSSNYDWSGRVSPPSVRMYGAPAISFSVDAPGAAVEFRSPRSESVDLDWRGRARGGFFLHNIFSSGARLGLDLQAALTAEFVDKSAIAPASHASRWWELSAEPAELLERFVPVTELYAMLGEPNPMVWSDRRFHEWLQCNP